MRDIKQYQEDLRNPLDKHNIGYGNYELEETEEASDSDSILDYSQLMQQVHFIGDVSFTTILENIKQQFEDYINIDNVTNYVSIFYKQLSDSYEKLNNNESEEYPQEIKNCLDHIYNIFVDNIMHLFEIRLFISINDAENITRDDLEVIIQRTYEYFILNAKNNFKTVISTSINGMIPETTNDDEYFQQLQSLMELFSPLIQKVTPIEFLQLTGDKEIFDLFNNGQIVGNFLRKYSPKLYQNELFSMEIINYTTMAHLFKEELDAPMTPEEKDILYKI